MSIRWTEQCVTEVVREMRAHNVAGGGHREATLDDLRKACEAVGLVCETRDERANVIRIAGQDGFARGCDTYKARVTELETALNNAANGIGFGDAGPVVYALNARHDEREKEWESEREELVRTRQETQDKLSEARKELTELRARAEKAERDADAYAAERDALRAQVAAAQQPTAERATDEELFAAYDKGMLSQVLNHKDQIRNGIHATAARVRAERCLVTRAVEMGKHFSVVSNDRGRWYVTVIGLGEENVAPSDVPATLARMLGGGQ